MRTDAPAARAAAALFLTAQLGGCAAVPDGRGDGQDASPAAPPSATAGMGPRDEASAPAEPPDRIFVFNTYGSEQGESERRPENLVATPSTSFTGLEWSSWGGGPATADGRVRGTWCLPECQDSPYPVRVELSGAEVVDGTAFYAHYSFAGRAGFPDGMRDRVSEVGTGRLTLPSAW
ncbi:hypothetical protein [Streptomonospora salina]|uniref:Lipoprotein n=1 Tax=Streptomonospora salina TaxID=104205 RepID=A0A841E654_9ACTN|nr:hypothetical protein [Streptomonospora salina]MBB5997934.1 hypothetical protein [Streptomonospora salina]